MNSDDDASSKPRVITPFPSPKLMDLPQFQGDHKESLYWGTYRPHVYLGLRARAPKSLIAGLMWMGVKDGQYHMRHICQDSDDLATYGWTEHNGRDYARQRIVDNGLTLETSFVKSKVEGSGYGGDWAVRIDVQNEKLSQDVDVLESGHLFFYVADEDENDISLNRDCLGVRGSSLLASGSRGDVGGWQLHLESPVCYHTGKHLISFPFLSFHFLLYFLSFLFWSFSYHFIYALCNHLTEAKSLLLLAVETCRQLLKVKCLLTNCVVINCRGSNHRSRFFR